MTLLSNNPTLFIFGVIVSLYFIAILIKFPILPAAIYPFTFLIFTQTMFAVGGISPSKYLGAVLIFVGMISFLKDVLSRANRSYSAPGIILVL